MPLIFSIIASAYGALAVATGAFGAHGLAHKVSPERLVTWMKGADYMMYHAPALFIAAILLKAAPSTAATVACWSFLVGVLLFSGSLFTIVLSDIKKFGAITPIGGTLFIVGWISLAVAATSYFK